MAKQAQKYEHDYIYNVTVGGVSIGMTFSYTEAWKWVAESASKQSGSKDVAVHRRIYSSLV